MVNQDDARRSQNRANAIALAKNGIPVFPSSGKTPLIYVWKKLDTEVTPEDIEEAKARAAAEEQKDHPKWFGASRDPERVKRMWRHPNHNAVPSIACGPARLVVIDADVKFNGVELIEKLFDEHGGVPAGVPIITTQSGGKHYIFSDPDNAFTNSPGALKKLYGCDVRGKGGQFVAPGSWREDGKKYGDKAGLTAFIAAYVNGTIPPVPDYVAELIGTPSEVGEEIAPSKEREVVKQLDEATVPDWEELCTPLGDYDFSELLSENEKFRRLHETPSDDCSDNRFKAAYHVMREWPDMPPSHLASFFFSWDGAGGHVEGKPHSGEYDNRQIAREWLKNRKLTKTSTGKAFPPVVDDDEISEHDAFIANGGTEEQWNAWRERLAHEREERLARAERERVSDDAQSKSAQSEGAERDKLKKEKHATPFAFELEHDVATNAKPPVWLVHELLEERTLSVVYGQPNSGKSLVLLDMLFHIAAGKPWRNRDVKRGCVLYLAVEGPQGTARRAKAWRVHHAIADDEHLPLAFIRVGVNLYASDRDAKKIVAAVKALEERTQLPCVAVAIDTLSAVTPGMDQNNEMGTFVQHCRTILEGTKATVIVVHHDGKDQSRGLKGDSALLGTVDSTVLVKDRIAETKKMRDGPSGQKFPFEIRILNLWTDEKGRPVTAPVAVEPERGGALGAVDDDEEAPPLKVSDTKEDRIAMLLAVAREEAERAAAEDEPVSSVALSPATLRDALNARRRQLCTLDGKPLTLLDRTGVKRVTDKAIEDGALSERRGRLFVAD